VPLHRRGGVRVPDQLVEVGAIPEEIGVEAPRRTRYPGRMKHLAWVAVLALSAPAAAEPPPPELELWQLGIDLRVVFDHHADARRTADAFAEAKELAHRLMDVDLDPLAGLGVAGGKPEMYMRETMLQLRDPTFAKFGVRGVAVLALTIEVALVPDSLVLDRREVAKLIERTADAADVAKVCTPLVAALRGRPDASRLVSLKDATLKQLYDAFAKRRPREP
jgi:hypothetical protein